MCGVDEFTSSPGLKCFHVNFFRMFYRELTLVSWSSSKREDLLWIVTQQQVSSAVSEGNFIDAVKPLINAMPP